MSYLPSRKAAALLGLHPQTLRRYARQGKINFYLNSGGQRQYDVDSYLRGQADPETICYCRVSSAKQRGDLERQVAHMREIYPTAQVVTETSPVDSTGNARDCSPYWNDYTAEISSLLWLPTGTDSPDSDLNSSSGLSSKTAAESWFSTSTMPAPNPSSLRIFSPSSILSVAACTDSEGTAQQSRRIRVYPTTQQKLTIKAWLDASRWVYNLTVEILKEDVPANWKKVAKTVMPQLARQHPE